MPMSPNAHPQLGQENACVRVGFRSRIPSPQPRPVSEDLYSFELNLKDSIEKLNLSRKPLQDASDAILFLLKELRVANRKVYLHNRHLSNKMVEKFILGDASKELGTILMDMLFQVCTNAAGVRALSFLEFRLVVNEKSTLKMVLDDEKISDTEARPGCVVVHMCRSIRV